MIGKTQKRVRLKHSLYYLFCMYTRVGCIQVCFYFSLIIVFSLFAIKIIGTIIRHDGFTSTTSSIDIALKWNGNVIFKYYIPKGCLNARKIDNISKYPHEKEVLLPPYTAVKLLSFKSNISNLTDIGKLNTFLNKQNYSKYALITFNVLDNFTAVTSPKSHSQTKSFTYVKPVSIAPLTPKPLTHIKHVSIAPLTPPTLTQSVSKYNYSNYSYDSDTKQDKSDKYNNNISDIDPSLKTIKYYRFANSKRAEKQIRDLFLQKDNKWKLEMEMLWLGSVATVSGIIPFRYKYYAYKVAIQMVFYTDFPNNPPHCYITSSVVLNKNCKFLTGRSISHWYLSSWKAAKYGSYSKTISEFVGILSKEFGTDPPIKI